MSGTIAKRYAKALYQVASERGQLDQVEIELDTLEQLLAEHPAFLQLLQHPQLSKDVKKQQVEQIFGEQLSETMNTFIKLLIDRNREEILVPVSHFFTSFANQARGLADATVTSVKPLNENEQQNLSEHFGRLLNKQIRIHNQVNANIVGGVVVKIGDMLYDGSVAGKLNRFKRRLETSKS
jgi:F-type H+-transporting ATPase subunit delta